MSTQATIQMEEINENDHPQKGILKTAELYKYILETSVFPREPEHLQELRKVTKNRPLNIMATTPDSGQLLSMLLKLTNSKKTIEIGVFTGYSLLLTALSIPDDGKIIAIDPDLESYKFGLPVIQKAGVEHKIEFINSEGLPALDKLLENPENEGSFDFAFVDADKNNSLNYHERLVKLVKVGGVIVHDNTLWGGTVSMPDEEVNFLLKEGRPHAIKLVKAIVADPRTEIAHVSVGDGMIICRRLY